MIIHKEDLIGAIADFPIEIVQQMVENQVAQGNPANIKIFQNKKDTPRRFGGFDWNVTPQGTKYWSKIINGGIYNSFTESEVISPTPKAPKYKFGDIIKVKRGEGVVEKVIVAYVPECPNPIWCVSKTMFERTMSGDSNRVNMNADKEVEEPIYLTLKDISEGKGVGIDPSLIKII